VARLIGICCKSDERLYGEGSFWFNKKRFTYNFLDRNFGGNYSFPVKWEGNSTYTNYIITEELLDVYWQKHESKNQLLRSIELFQAILNEYPDSNLKEKAAYSIALSYYWLYLENWELRSTKDTKEIAINLFNKFVYDFPKSAMADDALLSIAFLEYGSSYRNFSRNKEDKANAQKNLERLIREYPNSDRVQEAKEMLKTINNEKE
jgi:outer membrane protein assembly factor BamD (BamD/ComL family)